MTTRNEWRIRFETFLSEVPREKRSSSRLKWVNYLEEMVNMYYGIGMEPKTIQEIGKYFCLCDGRIKHLLHQARRMYIRYQEAKAKNEATSARRARLAEEIRKALV